MTLAFINKAFHVVLKHKTLHSLVSNGSLYAPSNKEYLEEEFWSKTPSIFTLNLLILFITENKIHIHTPEEWAPISASHIPQFKDAKIQIKAHKIQEIIVSEQLFDG